MIDRRVLDSEICLEYLQNQIPLCRDEVEEVYFENINPIYRGNLDQVISIVRDLPRLRELCIRNTVINSESIDSFRNLIRKLAPKLEKIRLIDCGLQESDLSFLFCQGDQNFGEYNRTLSQNSQSFDENVFRRLALLDLSNNNLIAEDSPWRQKIEKRLLERGKPGGGGDGAPRVYSPGCFEILMSFVFKLIQFFFAWTQLDRLAKPLKF